ncbi:Trp biosynthesis-associated membrane protein [Kribbella sandramycini]|uniref:Putative membrane protein (TIGR02234 family) n=1 Tax=Kribbella sandramycini TaxID=60450 RepID=A0A7Y4KU26_9ACTN|nr:Trp biosynthesis-associated membrane protein [Kribbella sandramycini]MBB6568755.1 putative membrane protein (TIGR02234 family) [Kribbella sandramycini]NOL38662.1 Trp biosynthesis-associated membrane protein [Kribbella sandramycini]
MRPQRLVDLLALAALVLLGLSAYLTWATADPGGGRAVVEFNGHSMTRAPVTLALAAVVAVIVTKLAGTALRRVIGGLVALLGAAAIGVALQVRPSVEELSRLRPELSQAVTDRVVLGVGPAPWFALAGGVALLAAGALTALTAHRWQRATARYERETTVSTADREADQWKAIDAGQDPTL